LIHDFHGSCCVGHEVGVLDVTDGRGHSELDSVQGTLETLFVHELCDCANLLLAHGHPSDFKDHVVKGTA